MNNADNKSGFLFADFVQDGHGMLYDRLSPRDIRDYVPEQSVGNIDIPNGLGNEVLDEGAGSETAKQEADSAGVMEDAEPDEVSSSEE